jgi:hypothetical protein
VCRTTITVFTRGRFPCRFLVLGVFVRCQASFIRLPAQLFDARLDPGVCSNSLCSMSLPASRRLTPQGRAQLGTQEELGEPTPRWAFRKRSTRTNRRHLASNVRRLGRAACSNRDRRSPGSRMMLDSAPALTALRTGTGSARVLPSVRFSCCDDHHGGGTRRISVDRESGRSPGLTRTQACPTGVSTGLARASSIDAPWLAMSSSGRYETNPPPFCRASANPVVRKPLIESA